MTKVAERVRTAPRRKGVRREAAVHERHMRLKVLFEKIHVVARKLGAREHPLVVHHTGRQRTDVEGDPGDHAGPIRGLLSQHIQSSLELPDVLCQRPLGSKEALLNAGLEVLGRLPEASRVHRDLAPANELETADSRAEILHDELALPSAILLLSEEDVANCVLPQWGEIKALLLGNPTHELVGHAAENASTVSSVQLTATGTAVIQVLEDLQCAFHDVPADFPLQ
mmetsp:Transcript_51255/g.111242  ORF Transcript_51255/g.111242 Transcript_51255/m.111242 type:complete len:226 (+) Transcript_51255:2215-2892(+)